MSGVQMLAVAARETCATLSDEEIVRRVVAGETELYEILMRRHNQRLYRVTQTLLRDSAEAEDVMQDAYVRAYANLRQFRGESRFSTWLIRIAVYESYARLRRHRRQSPIELSEIGDTPELLMSNESNPEEQALAAETRNLLEAAIQQLPSMYRTAFVLRELENSSIAEIAAALDISEENVKIRVHRARLQMRRILYRQFGTVVRDAFAFAGARCDRIVETVLQRISGMEIA